MEHQLKDSFTSLLQKLIGNQLPFMVEPAKVISVDKQAKTIECKSLTDNGVFLDVRLNAQQDSDNGFMCFPEIDSTVLIAIINNNPNEAFVVMQSEIESILLVVGNETKVTIESDGKVKIKASQLELEADQITMNGGNNGALVKLPVLETEIAKNSTFLTAIKTAIATAPITPADGGASFKASLTTALSSLQTANLSSAGNAAIKH